MSSNLIQFKQIIREANYDNTYKMAWAKALVEIVLSKEIICDPCIINFNEISVMFFKYYWNQTIFFNLAQGSNITKRPKVVQIVCDVIDEYFRLIQCKKPVRFERIEKSVLERTMQKKYKRALSLISSTLKVDVSWRFKKIGSFSYEIYHYNRGEDYLILRRDFCKELIENSVDLFELINYRWGLILEAFNSSPRINRKVKIIDEQEIKRESLSSFKRYLDLENREHICSICGKPISDEELSIDHVIPWSYLYSDDLWNLVYVHKKCNSNKSNRIPTKEQIDSLKVRNKSLLELAEINQIHNKTIDELRMSIQFQYVDKFWIGCK